MTTGYGLSFDPAWQGDAPIPQHMEPTEYGVGTWPRMLVLGEDVENRLRMWLQDEIFQARAERQPLIEDWTRWQTQYWAKPEREIRNWPFPRAANIVIPLTAIAVEAVHARLYNTLFSVEPFYSLRPKSPEWVQVGPYVERWFQTKIEDPTELNMSSFCSDSLLELCKLGTCVGKSGYDRELRKTLRTNADGRTYEYYHEVRNGATLDYVPLANFICRVSETDPQTALWLGEEHTFSWTELKRMAQSGRLDPDAVEKVKLYYISQRTESSGDAGDYHEKVDDLQHVEPIWNERFVVHEIWCSFDVDNDGVDEEIVIDFHERSGTILSARYNWYDDLHRPYRVVQYIPVEGRLYGIGIGKQNEQFQEEVTTIHRQRLDNATLANMGMLALKKDSGYGAKEPIFPGKMWFLDDVQDIAPVKLSEVYNSAFANEDVINRYSEMRTGVNEVMAGLPHEGTPGTATGDLARLAEGNKRFDFVLRRVRSWLSELGTDCLANYQQFGNQQEHWLTLGSDGQYVEQFLQMPPILVRRGAILEVTATNSITNREVEQRQWMALFQLLNQHASMVLQLAGAIDEQIFQQLVIEAVKSSGEAMARLLGTFNVVDAEKLILGLDLVRSMTNGTQAGAGLGAGGPGGLPPGANSQGMGGVPIGALGPGRTPVQGGF